MGLEIREKKLEVFVEAEKPYESPLYSVRVGGEEVASSRVLREALKEAGEELDKFENLYEFMGSI